jgi:hypothetical protein
MNEIFTHPIVILAIYILIGLAWSDLLLFLQRKYSPQINYTRTIKRTTMIMWPISVLIFIISLIVFFIKGINQK